MLKDWRALTNLTRGAPILIERVRLPETDLAIEGEFEPPPLARLSAEDQVFVTAFVRCHGSIKQMERYFGVSYPTIKNRLNRIGEALPFVEMEQEREPEQASDVLDRLERGEITAAEALALLKAGQTEDRHE